jgi:putative sterol carrier protein
MSSHNEIEEALLMFKKKLDEPKIKARFADYTKTIELYFTDIDKKYLITIKNGEFESLKQESIDSPDISLIVESRIFINILNKKIRAMQAYTSGKLKAKGKLMDILKLQKLL